MPGARTEQLGWAFLVARGRERGYRTILAPDFVAERNEQGVLTEGVEGDVDPSGRARIEQVVAPSAGMLTLAYRTHRVTAGDLNGDGGPDLVTDDHGRPLDLLYGFVTPAGGLRVADEADLAVAKGAALQAYRRFLADEAGFAVEVSGAFPLRSAIDGRARPPRPPGQRRQPAGAGHRQGQGRGLNVAVVMLAVAVLATATMLWSRRSSSGPEPFLRVPAAAGCELVAEGGELSCTIGVEVRASGEVTARTPEPRDGVTWAPGRCRPSGGGDGDRDGEVCTLRVDVQVAPGDALREHTARLTVALAGSDLTADVALRATPPRARGG